MSTDITASFTATANISLGSSASQPAAVDNPTHASTTMQNGQAVFENDNYRITADDNNTVTIYNKETGSTYQAAGDPHVSVNGQHSFDFWGTTTFKLDDGTKVTIQTTPYSANPNATLSSKVTITNGDYGVQISGVDSNTHGDLKIDEAAGWGRTLDWAVDDGNKIHENAAGNGFVATDAQGQQHAVDQNWINQTDLVKNPNQPQNGGAGQQLANAYKDAFKFLTGLISIAFLGGFRAGQDSGGSSSEPTNGSSSHAGGHMPRFGFEPWQGGNIFLQGGSLSLTESVSFTLHRNEV